MRELGVGRRGVRAGAVGAALAAGAPARPTRTQPLPHQIEAEQVVDHLRNTACSSGQNAHLTADDQSGTKVVRGAPGPSAHSTGAGYGHRVCYADGSTGPFAGHRWSVNDSTVPCVAQQPMSAARVYLSRPLRSCPYRWRAEIRRRRYGTASRVGGMVLAHEVTGNGPAVVLLHSGVCDRRMWTRQQPALAGAGHRVVSCDFRGFGESPLTAQPHNDPEDVVELMDVLGIGRAALVASSYGGHVALEIAARYPERVAALALLCAGRPGHEPGAELREIAAREDALLEAGEVAAAVELNVETWLGPEAGEEARAAVRVMQQRAFDVQLAAPEGAGRRQVAVDLSAVRAPCLAVSGGRDVVDFRRIAADLPELLTGAEVRQVELPWAGHFPGLERPGETTELVTGFLKEAHPAE